MSVPTKESYKYQQRQQKRSKQQRASVTTDDTTLSGTIPPIKAKRKQVKNACGKLSKTHK